MQPTETPSLYVDGQKCLLREIKTRAWCAVCGGFSASSSTPRATIQMRVADFFQSAKSGGVQRQRHCWIFTSSASIEVFENP